MVVKAMACSTPAPTPCRPRNITSWNMLWDMPQSALAATNQEKFAPVEIAQFSGDGKGGGRGHQVRRDYAGIVLEAVKLGDDTRHGGGDNGRIERGDEQGEHQARHGGNHGAARQVLERGVLGCGATHFSKASRPGWPLDANRRSVIFVAVQLDTEFNAHQWQPHAPPQQPPPEDEDPEDGPEDFAPFAGAAKTE